MTCDHARTTAKTGITESVALHFGILAFSATLVLAGCSRQQASQISVGREVMVSGTDTLSAYSEYDADLDPSDPNRIMVCAQPYVPSLNERKGTVHVSTDGGTSWGLTLEVPPARNGLIVGDPTCAFGLEGTALLSVLIQNEEGNARGGGTWRGWLDGDGQQIHRSTDGGNTWAAPYQIGFVDNQNLLVDRTSSRYRGRIYMHGNSTGNAFWLAYSTDQGRSFVRGELEPVEGAWRQVDRGVILADGTVLLPYRIADESNPNRPDAPGTTTYGVSRSTDGGVHLSTPDTVSTRRTTCEGLPPQILPEIAVDNSNGPFHGRVYYLWGEVEADQGGISPRCLPVIASSDDAGKTWSPPAQIVDAPFRAEPQRGPDARLPALAVNPQGVVGVTWYDRREDPENRSARLRFSASLDGGETWLPSVPVSTETLSVDGARVYSVVARVTGGGQSPASDITGSPPPRATGMAVTSIRAEVRQRAVGIGGDYSDLVADPSGAFHAFWVDNRGDAATPGHLFTTVITVGGVVNRNGAEELATLDNVTREVEFQYHYANAKWEAGYLNVDVGLVLRNVSSDTIKGPLKLRILGVRSQAGPVVLLDTGVAASGVVLDLSSVMSGTGFAPGASTAPYEIRLRAGPVPAELADDGPYGIGTFNAKVFGTSPPSR